MIFLSEYPTGKSDGMLERVKFIDNLFIDRKRVYISLSFKCTNWSEIDIGNLKIVKANPLLHYSKINKFFSSAKLLYAHSLVNAYKALLFYNPNVKLVFDVHGAVPEEAEYLCGSKIMRRILSILEMLVLRRSSLNIVVTDSMRDHLLTKHSRGNPEKYLLLPIIGNVSIVEDSIRVRNKVVYAGGIQKWQNIELMLDFICTCKDFSYLILTPHPNAFERIKNMPNVEISYATQSDIHKHYQTSEFGFILRDAHILNKVACPTKLVEYLTAGVIPIVLEPNIGDFKSFGYRYVSYDELIHGLHVEYKNDNAIINYEVVEKIKSLENIGTKRLLNYFNEVLSC